MQAGNAVEQIEELRSEKGKEATLGKTAENE